MITQLRLVPPRVPTRPLRVGVSGGVGCGKTLLVAYLGELGAHCFDADAFLREATAPQGSALAQLRRAFGDGVFTSDGSLDRDRLAGLIFSDAAAKTELEGILHPQVWQEMDRILLTLDPQSVLVAEIPLLVETNGEKRFDVVVMVDAPLELRLARLGESRGWTREQAQARIDAQATTAQRQAVTHFWVENTGDAASLREDAAKLWRIFLEL